ncbi:MAG: trypsin-like peptidase domain-containing protein, partial [Planctomycetota bacterium]
DTAVRGSAMWQTWVDKNPGHPDIDAAKEELAVWKERVDADAEKINGAWVGGEDLEDLLERVRVLTDRAAAALNDQVATLDTVKDLEEARKLYPKYIPTNFYLGYWNALKGRYGPAARYFETVLRQRPKMSEAMNNIAIIYSFNGQHERAIRTFHEAVQLDENPTIVKNLMHAFERAPRSMYQANPRIRPIWEDIQLLSRKHGGASDRFWLVHIKPSDQRSPEEEESYGSGIIGFGTGFFISEDGFIMTNQHVAEPGDTLIVRLSDGTEKEAERIIIDDEQDIAILKIVTDEQHPFIPLAAYDQPNFGADVTILGFPLGKALGKNVKITRGVVTGVESQYDKVDIFTDATVNPGNSGGPMVDKYGRLLALVAMKTYSSADTTSYGMGLSNVRLREFFDKHTDLLTDAGMDVEVTATGLGDGEQAFTTEELAQKLRPATVQIMMVND